VEIRPRRVVEYLDAGGKSPFESWLENLKDLQARAAIRKRLNRIRLGNLGDSKALGDGVHELRVDLGPGYRVYYGIDGDTIVVLLCGGDKRSQTRDISRAKQYWRDYWS
jgi:putative addiction module killer protein